MTSLDHHTIIEAIIPGRCAEPLPAAIITLTDMDSPPSQYSHK